MQPAIRRLPSRPFFLPTSSDQLPHDGNKHSSHALCGASHGLWRFGWRAGRRLPRNCSSQSHAVAYGSHALWHCFTCRTSRFCITVVVFGVLLWMRKENESLMDNGKQAAPTLLFVFMISAIHEFGVSVYSRVGQISGVSSLFVIGGVVLSLRRVLGCLQLIGERERERKRRWLVIFFGGSADGE